MDIKIIGVGTCGYHAVTHMYRKGIHDVSFMLCSADRQALMHSEISVKLVLGHSGSGLDAGNNPERWRIAALESENEIRRLLNDGTKMVIIIAGMGGSTGTGASPVIAAIAREMNILTVGIVTIPFLFEGKRKIIKALNGVEEMNRNVDTLLIINYEHLHKTFHDLSLQDIFGKADEALAIAVKNITEIITLPGIIHLPFADIHSIMKDGGVTFMNNGYGQGEGGLEQAIENALDSPYLNSDEVFRSKKILLHLSFSKDAEIKVEELNIIHDFMARFRQHTEAIWGASIDDTLGEKVKVLVLATGFGLDDIPEMKDNMRLHG
ncbi:MAG: cell division FtsZ family protein [Tannerella sp.]|jgi:cell division protein FtsZ|nr:cell division FtsZ family protein [Tannerella sp.]